MEIYCKAGSVELTKEEAEEIYASKKYIVTSTAIWKPNYSQEKDKIYFTKVSSVKGMARKGRFYKLTAEEINNVLGENT